MFLRKVQFQIDIIDAYLEDIPLANSPKLTNGQAFSCKGVISEYEVPKSLKSIEINKSTRNDRLSKKLYECFWNEAKKAGFNLYL